MKNWKRKVLKKQARFSQGQASGKSKGGSCQASTMQRYFAKRSRSYKHKDYANWCRWADIAASK